MEHLSENSEPILMRDTTFRNIVKKKDVAKLWKLIVDAHSIMGLVQWDRLSLVKLIGN
jgi:hypothetical protein